MQLPLLNFIEQIRDFWSRLSLFIFNTKLSHYCFYGVINIIIICSRFDIMSWYKLKTYMILIWMKHGDQFMINFISPIWVYIFVTVTSDVRMHSFYSETNKMTLWSLRRTHLKRSIFCFTTDFQLNIVVKPILKTVLSFRVKLPNPAQQDKSTTMIVGLLVLTDSFCYEPCLLLLLYYLGTLITWIYMNVKPDHRRLINSCLSLSHYLWLKPLV